MTAWFCLERGANDLFMVQLMPLPPPPISCFIKIQIGLTFLVPAYPGWPEKGTVQRVSVLGMFYRQCSIPSGHLSITVKAPKRHLLQTLRHVPTFVYTIVIIPAFGSLCLQCFETFGQGVSTGTAFSALTLLVGSFDP